MLIGNRGDIRCEINRPTGEPLRNAIGVVAAFFDTHDQPRLDAHRKLLEQTQINRKLVA